MNSNEKRELILFWEFCAYVAFIAAIAWAIAGVSVAISGTWDIRVIKMVALSTLFFAVLFLMALFWTVCHLVIALRRYLKNRYQAKLNRAALRFKF